MRAKVHPVFARTEHGQQAESEPKRQQEHLPREPGSARPAPAARTPMSPKTPVDAPTLR